MNSIERLTVVPFLIAVLGCSSTGSVADAAADSATDSGLHSCYQPLPASGWFCQGTFAEQAASNPCGDTTSRQEWTCGQYQVWRNSVGPMGGGPGKDCIFDNNQNGVLVGAITCGTADDVCTNGCIEYGSILVSQLTNCGPRTDLCSAPP